MGGQGHSAANAVDVIGALARNTLWQSPSPAAYNFGKEAYSGLHVGCALAPVVRRNSGTTRRIG